MAPLLTTAALQQIDLDVFSRVKVKLVASVPQFAKSVTKRFRARFVRGRERFLTKSSSWRDAARYAPSFVRPAIASSASAILVLSLPTHWNLAYGFPDWSIPLRSKPSTIIRNVHDVQNVHTINPANPF